MRRCDGIDIRGFLRHCCLGGRLCYCRPAVGTLSPQEKSRNLFRAYSRSERPVAVSLGFDCFCSDCLGISGQHIWSRPRPVLDVRAYHGFDRPLLPNHPGYLSKASTSEGRSWRNLSINDPCSRVIVSRISSLIPGFSRVTFFADRSYNIGVPRPFQVSQPVCDVAGLDTPAFIL